MCLKRPLCCNGPSHDPVRELFRFDGSLGHSHSQSWLAMANRGCVAAGRDWPRLVVASHSRPLLAAAGRGWPWLAVTGRGWLWLAMVRHCQPWPTKADHVMSVSNWTHEDQLTASVITMRPDAEGCVERWRRAGNPKLRNKFLASFLGARVARVGPTTTDVDPK